VTSNLKEAGYENGVGLPTMSYTTNDAGFNKKVAEYLQQAWKELGINVEVNIVFKFSHKPFNLLISLKNTSTALSFKPTKKLPIS